MYNGKNRTPYVKDAFYDHIIPSHRPKEPEPERKVDAGLQMKRTKTPGSPVVSTKSAKLPPNHEDTNGQAQTDDGDDKQPEASEDVDEREHIVTPPPRPTSQSGGRVFVNPEKKGTKAGAHYVFNNVPGKGGCVVVRLKMTPASTEEDPSILDEELFDDNIDERRMDADEFYGSICSNSVSDDLKNIMRQALSGMLWYV